MRLGLSPSSPPGPPPPGVSAPPRNLRAPPQRRGGRGWTSPRCGRRRPAAGPPLGRVLRFQI